MKKILALVLALVMVLTAVAALAAGPGSPESGANKNNGPTTNGTTGGTTGNTTTNNTSKDEDTTQTDDTETEIELKEEQDNDDTAAIKSSLKDLEEKGDVLTELKKDLPEEIVKALGTDYTVIMEMDTVTIPKDAKSLTFKTKIQSATNAKVGEKVVVMIAVTGKDGNIEWFSASGIVNEMGEVVYTLDENTYNEIAGKKVVVMPVCKPV